MKEYYKIGEIARIYGIGQDSLRYYEELGLLRPRRAENGYRMYSIRDIRVLNIIRELRGIGFTMSEIKDHLKNFDLEKTRDLFIREKEMVDSKIKEFEALKEQLEMRITDINMYLDMELKPETFVIEHYPKRYVIKLSDKAFRDEELDFIIKKLQLEYQDTLYIIGNGDIGATIPGKDFLLNKKYGMYDSVFYIVDESEKYDDVLDEGIYATYIAKGRYELIPNGWNKLFQQIEKEGYEAVGQPIELYLVDNHDTSKEEEYITKLEIRIEKK